MVHNNKKTISRTSTTKVKHNYYYLTEERYKNYLKIKYKAREIIKNLKVTNFIKIDIPDISKIGADMHAENLLNLNETSNISKIGNRKKTKIVNSKGL